MRSARDFDQSSSRIASDCSWTHGRTARGTTVCEANMNESTGRLKCNSPYQPNNKTRLLTRDGLPSAFRGLSGRRIPEVGALVALPTFPPAIVMSTRFLFTRGSPSGLSAAVLFVPPPAFDADAPWYAASSAAGFAFLRPPWGLLGAGACEGAAAGTGTLAV